MLRQNLVSAYPKQVRLYFKTFPLEQIHNWAKAGAIASRCVYRQKPDAFWNFHDWIFAHQTEITPDNLKNQVMEWAKSQKEIDVPGALVTAACHVWPGHEDHVRGYATLTEVRAALRPHLLESAG